MVTDIYGQVGWYAVVPFAGNKTGFLVLQTVRFVGWRFEWETVGSFESIWEARVGML